MNWIVQRHNPICRYHQTNSPITRLPDYPITRFSDYQILPSPALHELREQIDRDAAAVIGSRSEVVDWRELAGERSLRLLECGAAGKRGFRPDRTDHGWGDTAQRNPRRRSGDAGHHDLRDRLRCPRADLAEVLPSSH